MPTLLTEEIAREAVGLCVVQNMKTGPNSWKCPARLVSVKNRKTAVIKPNNHKREEEAEIGNLRLFAKGNHDLGAEPRRRSEQLELLATLMAACKSEGLTRELTVEEAQQRLSNGENPIVLLRISDDHRGMRYLAASLLAVKDGNAVVKLFGANRPPQTMKWVKIAVPEFFDLADIDHGLIDRLLGHRGPLPGSSQKDILFEHGTEPDPIPEPVAEATPEPRPEPPPIVQPAAKVTTPRPPPSPTAPPTEEPPKIERLHGRGEWVIVDLDAHTFWRSGPGIHNAWVKDVDAARVFVEAGGCSTAAGRLRKHSGRRIEVMTPGRARYFSSMWYRPRRLPEPERPSTPVAIQGSESAVNIPAGQPAERREENAAPQSPPATPSAVGTSPSEALRKAIVERGEAEALGFEARAAEARARAAYEASRVA